MRRPPAPPLWFAALVAIAVAAALRVWAPAPSAEAPREAFFGFLLAIAGWIWEGVQVAGKVALEVLQWSVKALWAFATTTYNGLKALGVVLRDALYTSWDFFRATYEKVLKPAWEKFWRWFDRFRKWMDATFAPVLRFLRRVRDSLLLFYKTFIRPWLDLLDVTRHALRVLSSLGVTWARTLDQKLSALEEKLERPFRLVLAKVNEVIDIVNRVVTLDGLLQRLVLVRSLARDYEYAWRAIVNPYSSPLTADTRGGVWPDKVPDVRAPVVSGVTQYLDSGGGPYAAEITAAARAWIGYLES